MTKKNISLIVLALLLGALSIYLNKDRFSKPTIQIGERWIEPRPWMVRQGHKQNSKMLMFLLDQKVQLTSVKVVPLEDAKTNKYPHPIWELTTESNSIPLKEFIYGMPIRGMKPSVKGAVADPLQPNVDYRLYVSGDSFKVQYEFAGSPKAP